VINGRDIQDFFLVERIRLLAGLPLQTSGMAEKVDVMVNLEGGGLTGQAGAVRLGIARALIRANPSLDEALREAGHLTRDSRMKERKHFGFRGARRGTQFSKR
jgi:small subunit ribosomal protein S9